MFAFMPEIKFQTKEDLLLCEFTKQLQKLTEAFSERGLIAVDLKLWTTEDDQDFSGLQAS